MEGVTRASTKTIRSMGSEFTPGKTVDNTWDSGKTDNSMDKASTKM